MTPHKRLKSPKFFVFGIILLVISIYAYLYPAGNTLTSEGLYWFIAKTLVGLLGLVFGGVCVAIGITGRE